MPSESSDLLNRLTNGGQDNQNLLSITSAPVHKGLKQVNLLTVIAQGSSLSLFVNKQYIGGLSDSTYQSGAIALYVDSDSGVAEGSFSNAQVWVLP